MTKEEQKKVFTSFKLYNPSKIQLFLIIFILVQMDLQSINSSLIKNLLIYSEKKQISNVQKIKLNNKIAEQIDIGQLSIPEPQADNQSYINHNKKKEALKNIYESEGYNNCQRDIRIMKGIFISQIQASIPSRRHSRKKVIKIQQQIKHKKTDEQIKKEFLAKKKIWQQQRDKILRRKQNIEMKKKSLQLSSEEKRKKQQQEIKQFIRLQRQKKIEAKLRQLNQRKAKRFQSIRKTPQKKSLSVPRYIQVEQKFHKQQIEKQLQKKKIFKNQRQQLQIKMEQIKQHERLYIQRIKQRFNAKSENKQTLDRSNISISNNYQSFNINKKDKKERKKIQEKIKRIKEMQKKIILIPLKIDTQKRIQMQIMADKLKNKHKYNFLSQKALSDEIIYEEFKDFDMNIDKKQLGNQYLQELKQINNKIGNRKVSSQKVLPASKPQYKDYINQLRLNKSIVLNPDEFDSIVKKLSKSKDKSVEKNYLLAKSQQFQQKAIQKIHELKKLDNYHDAVKKYEQIDKNYMKAIQAKLALVKIQ